MSRQQEFSEKLEAIFSLLMLERYSSLIFDRLFDNIYFA
jgi:hypothetical protein